MKLTWLGQSGYLVETETTRFVVDPYLSDVVNERQGYPRLIPPPIELEGLRPDCLLITHDHLDHYDPVSIPRLMDLYGQCVLVGPQSVMEHARKDGLPESRLMAIDTQQTLDLFDVHITATPARHSDPCSVGFIIRCGSTKIYISGDSEFYQELAGEINKLSPVGRLDAGIVVMNGRRGNMNHQEAASLLNELRPRFCIPMHYGMFAANTADPSDFVCACEARGLQSLVLDAGCPLSIA